MPYSYNILGDEERLGMSHVSGWIPPKGMTIPRTYMIDIQGTTCSLTVNDVLITNNLPYSTNYYRGALYGVGRKFGVNLLSPASASRLAILAYSGGKKIITGYGIPDHEV